MSPGEIGRITFLEGERMWFQKKKKSVPPGRVAMESSICTGETVIGFLDETGKLCRAEAVRSRKDMEEFCRAHGVPREEWPQWRERGK